MKRILGISLTSFACFATVIPASLALVSCADEQNQTNSASSNANRPSSNKPSNSHKPNPNQPTQPSTPSKPTQPSKPVEPSSNLIFDSSKVKSIYNNINSQLNNLKKNSDPLPLLTYAYLNNDGFQKPAETNPKATSNGFKTDVMIYIQKLMKTHDLSRAIKTATFDVDRYAENITFTINFFPKAFKGNPLSGNSHVSYGDNGKDKNTLVMTFSMKNIGLSTYVTYHVLEKITLCLQEYVQNLYDQSISNIDYNVLNNSIGQIQPIMIKHGVNYKLVCRPDCRFSIPTASTNSVVWNTGFHNNEVRYDPDCASGPDWEFTQEWGYLNPVWHGNLDRLYDQGRLNVLNRNIQKAITSMADAVNHDPVKLSTRINNKSFIQKMWNIVFSTTHLKLIDNGKVVTYLPIEFYDITTGPGRFERPSFLYRYKFTLPPGTPLTATFEQNSWIQKYFKITHEKNGSITFDSNEPMYAYFVEPKH